MHYTLSDIILDTVQNSIEAGARNITLLVSEDAEKFFVSVKDDGKGMDASQIGRVFDPFFTEAGKHMNRKVGLGLPFLKQLCDTTGGSAVVESQKGAGTLLKCEFPLNHIDLPPLGDLPEAILMLFNYPGEFELVFTRRKGGKEYSFARSELAEAVGGLGNAISLKLEREYLSSCGDDFQSF